MTKSGEVLCGFHAVETALKAPKSEVAELVHDGARRDPRLTQLLALARAKGVKLHRADRSQLDQLSGGVRHQGVIALSGRAPAQGLAELKVWLACLPEKPLVLVLDAIEDPRNFGACLRTAAAVGVDAVIFPAQTGTGLTPAALRVAAGGVHALRHYEVGNWSQVLVSLKQAGMWIVGAAEQEIADIYGFDMNQPLALVLGSEARGLRTITRKHCDVLLRIPTAQALRSLNVAVAAGVVLFEARRQRETG